MTADSCYYWSRSYVTIVAMVAFSRVRTKHRRGTSRGRGKQTDKNGEFWCGQRDREWGMRETVNDGVFVPESQYHKRHDTFALMVSSWGEHVTTWQHVVTAVLQDRWTVPCYRDDKFESDVKEWMTTPMTQCSGSCNWHMHVGFEYTQRASPNNVIKLCRYVGTGYFNYHVVVMMMSLILHVRCRRLPR